MKILSRYLASDVLNNSAVTAAVLSVLFFSQQLLRFLNRAAQGAILVKNLGSIIVLQLPNLLTVLLPVSMFLGIILAYSKLQLYKEPVAMISLGVTPKFLLKINLAIGLVVMVIVTSFSLWINPNAQRYIDELTSVETVSAFKAMNQRQFYQWPNLGLVVRVDNTAALDANKSSSNDFKGLGVFIAETDASNCVWVARKAENAYLDNYQGEFLHLTKGKRYCGAPGKADYEVVSFEDYYLRLPAPKPIEGDESTQSVRKLFRLRKSSLAAAAELQWRLAQPISAFILALAASAMSLIPILRNKPFSFIIAVLFYLIYLNGLLLARAWIKKGLISPSIGFWWVHALALLITLSLFWYGKVFNKHR